MENKKLLKVKIRKESHLLYEMFERSSKNLMENCKNEER